MSIDFTNHARFGLKVGSLFWTFSSSAQNGKGVNIQSITGHQLANLGIKRDPIIRVTLGDVVVIPIQGQRERFGYGKVEEIQLKSFNKDQYEYGDLLVKIHWIYLGKDLKNHEKFDSNSYILTDHEQELSISCIDGTMPNFPLSGFVSLKI